MTLLEQTKKAFADVRSSVIVAMQKLYQVKEEGAWESVASSWGEYVESELGISQGFSSKLLSVNKHYLLEANISPEKIENIDYECLYLAAKTEGTPEEQIEKARTLTRLELKQTKNDEAPHTPDFVEYCKTCHVTRVNHN